MFKKILIVALSVLMLVSAFLPVFAEETENEASAEPQVVSEPARTEEQAGGSFVIGSGSGSKPETKTETKPESKPADEEKTTGGAFIIGSGSGTASETADPNGEAKQAEPVATEEKQPAAATEKVQPKKDFQSEDGEEERHVHTVGTVIERREPNCYEEGFIRFRCADADCGLECLKILPAAHDYNENGVCRICKAKKTAEKSEETCDHSFVVKGHTEPTCTKNGAIESRCELCGEYRSIEIKATGHNFVNGVCKACGVAEKTLAAVEGSSGDELGDADITEEDGGSENRDIVEENNETEITDVVTQEDETENGGIIPDGNENIATQDGDPEAKDVTEDDGDPEVTDITEGDGESEATDIIEGNEEPEITDIVVKEDESEITDIVAETDGEKQLTEDAELPAEEGALTAAFAPAEGETLTAAAFAAIGGDHPVVTTPVTITVKSKKVVYDGKEHAAGYTAKGLRKGDQLVAEIAGGITDVGSSTCWIDSYKIYCDTEDVTDLYTNVDSSSVGTITITKRLLILKSGSGKKKYDGFVLSVGQSQFEVKGDGFAYGEYATANVTGMQLNAGSSPNYFTYEFIQGDPANYDIRVDFGTLTVTKRNVTLNSLSAEKKYNGKPLVEHTVAAGGDKFAFNEGFGYNVTGSQTKVGKSKNYFDYWLWPNTWKGNYNITVNYGTLRVYGGSTRTGVEDHWPVYFGGAAVLFVVIVILVISLSKKKKNER